MRFVVILSLISFVFIINCTGHPPEPMSYGDYYLQNNSDINISIAAQYAFGGKVKLLTNVVFTNQRVHFYTFSEGSGGHLYPSNAFSVFNLYNYTNSVIVYSKVDNNEWSYIGYTNGRTQLCLFVSNSNITW